MKFNIFKRRHLTPEEQAEKSRKEQEWAQKCYDAGTRFGERMNLKEKVDKINDFGNKYPKTFFSIIFGVIIGCFVLNLVISESRNFFKSTAEDIRQVQMPKDNGTAALDNEIQNLYQDYANLAQQLETMLAKEPKSHEDSMAILNVFERMERIQVLIEGEKNRSEEDLMQERNEIDRSIEELTSKVVMSYEDSVRLATLYARQDLLEELVNNNQ